MLRYIACLLTALEAAPRQFAFVRLRVGCTLPRLSQSGIPPLQDEMQICAIPRLAAGIVSSGTWNALRSGVTVAIPSWHRRVSPVLDTATRLLVVRCCHGRETGRREVLLGPLAVEAFARAVADLDVDVLLCGALSEGLWRALEQHGVRVRPHLCGEVEAVLRAFGCGQLGRDEFRMPGCRGAHLHRRRHSRGILCERPS
jgi:predicted Fe-Mo cluster-binding NifX family protein